MRISDWSSDVCSSDLATAGREAMGAVSPGTARQGRRHLRRKKVNMFNIHKTELMWGGRKLVIETGKVARQADGAVMVTYGDTIVLCTAVAAKSPKPGVDFFPLPVKSQEKTYAAGKVHGGLFKREGRPRQKGTRPPRL